MILNEFKWLHRTPEDFRGLQRTKEDSRGLKRNPNNSNNSEWIQMAPWVSTGLQRTPHCFETLDDKTYICIQECPIQYYIREEVGNTCLHWVMPLCWQQVACFRRCGITHPFRNTIPYHQLSLLSYVQSLKTLPQFRNSPSDIYCYRFYILVVRLKSSDVTQLSIFISSDILSSDVQRIKSKDSPNKKVSQN